MQWRWISLTTPKHSRSAWSFQERTLFYSNSSSVKIPVYISTTSVSKRRRGYIPGEQISGAEATLSPHSLYSSNTPAEMKETAQIQRRHKGTIRILYHSNTQYEKRRQFEWTKERYYDRIASNQRKASNSRRPLCLLEIVAINIDLKLSVIHDLVDIGKRSDTQDTPSTIVTNVYTSSQSHTYTAFCSFLIPHT